MRPLSQIYKQLHDILPESSAAAPSTSETDGGISAKKVKLGKKHVLLVTAAAGELYYFREYEKLLEVLDWLGTRYDLDSDMKFAESVRRWEGRAREQIESRQAQGNGGRGHAIDQ